MARSARQKSSTGIYYVMLRGINRQGIFHDEEDYCRFLEIVRRVKESGKVAIYGYCLMGNHVHLLLQEKEEGLSDIMWEARGRSFCFGYKDDTFLWLSGRSSELRPPIIESERIFK